MKKNLITLAIGVLTVVILFVVFGPPLPITARRDATIAQLEITVSAVHQYKMDHGSFPASLAGICPTGFASLATHPSQEFCVVADHVFFEDKKPFQYACDPQTNLLKLAVNE